MIFFLIWFTPSVFAATEPDQELIDIARDFFDTYREFSQNQYLAIVDLYSDEAGITIARKDADNQVKLVFLTGSQLKKILPEILPEAKRQGDIDLFFDENFTVISGEKVRIDCIRYSTLKNYRVPHRIVVRIEENGVCRIIQEKIEQKS
jgi:hypothetical protein